MVDRTGSNASPTVARPGSNQEHTNMEVARVEQSSKAAREKQPPADTKTDKEERQKATQEQEPMVHYQLQDDQTTEKDNNSNPWTEVQSKKSKRNKNKAKRGQISRSISPDPTQNRSQTVTSAETQDGCDEVHQDITSKEEEKGQQTQPNTEKKGNESDQEAEVQLKKARRKGNLIEEAADLQADPSFDEEVIDGGTKLNAVGLEQLPPYAIF